MAHSAEVLSADYLVSGAALRADEKKFHGRRSRAGTGQLQRGRYRTPVYMMRRAAPPITVPIRNIPITSSKSLVRLLCAV